MTDSATSRGDDAGTGAAEDTAPAPATVDPEPMEDQAFQLRAAPPIRALAIASAAAIAGAVVIALSGHPATTAVGAVVLAFGVLLAGAALLLTARLRSTVTLTADGIAVARGRNRARLDWGDIERVEQHDHRLVALAREGKRDLVIVVPARRGATYAALVESLRVRLDASRGYGTSTG